MQQLAFSQRLKGNAVDTPCKCLKSRQGLVDSLPSEACLPTLKLTDSPGRLSSFWGLEIRGCPSPTQFWKTLKLLKPLSSAQLAEQIQQPPTLQLQNPGLLASSMREPSSSSESAWKHI